MRRARGERQGTRRQRLQAVLDYAQARWALAVADGNTPERFGEFWRGVVHRLETAFDLDAADLIRDALAFETCTSAVRTIATDLSKTSPDQQKKATRRQAY